jgi:hypothetical protein
MDVKRQISVNAPAGQIWRILAEDYDKVGENADIELGYLLNDEVESPLRLLNGEQIDTTVLPRVETAATAVRLGPFENGYEPCAALGRWVEDNDYV